MSVLDTNQKVHTLHTTQSQLKLISSVVTSDYHGNRTASFIIEYGTQGLWEVVKVDADRFIEYLQQIDDDGVCVFQEAADEVDRFDLEDATISDEDVLSCLLGKKIVICTIAEKWNADTFNFKAATVQALDKTL